MSKKPLKISVAYLYPDFLRSYCDKANLDVLKLRAKERNINIEIEEICNNDKINSSKYDFYYISGSNIEALEACNKRIKGNIAPLQTAAEDSVPMLAIGCGYILFGNNFQLNNSPLYSSLGILNIETVMLNKPVSEKIVGTTGLLKDSIVGFSQRQTKTVLKENAHPFLYLKKDKTEGCIYSNVIGTYITSPILAQNPHMCDYIISKSLFNRYKCQIPLAKLLDDIEWYSHNYFLEAK